MFTSKLLYTTLPPNIHCTLFEESLSLSHPLELQQRSSARVPNEITSFTSNVYSVITHLIYVSDLAVSSVRTLSIHEHTPHNPSELSPTDEVRKRSEVTPPTETVLKNTRIDCSEVVEHTPTLHHPTVALSFFSSYSLLYKQQKKGGYRWRWPRCS